MGENQMMPHKIGYVFGINANLQQYARTWLKEIWITIQGVRYKMGFKNTPDRWTPCITGWILQRIPEIPCPECANFKSPN